MRLYFVRHGECIGQNQGFLQGQLNLGLSEIGLDQSNRLAERLSKFDIDIIYSSPMLRSQQTAEKILSYLPETPHIVSEKITGREYGDFQGMDFNDITGPNYSKRLSAIYKRTDGSLGVESKGSVHERVKKFLEELQEQFPNKNILIITHLEVKAACIQQLFHLDMPDDYHTASLTILEKDSSGRDFGTLNDITHLNEYKRRD